MCQLFFVKKLTAFGSSTGLSFAAARIETWQFRSSAKEASLSLAIVWRQ
jgi:hypothetical protein